MKIDSQEKAALAFRDLVNRYGLQWDAKVPKEAHDRLRECNRFLDEKGRRRALKVPRAN